MNGRSLIIFSVVLLLLPSVYAICPTDNLFVNTSVSYSLDFCNLTDSSPPGIIHINASNLVFSCTGATINGTNSSSVALIANGVTNVTISNCHFTNHYAALNVSNSNLFLNQLVINQSMFGLSAVNSTITLSNTFLNTTNDILLTNTTLFLSNTSYASRIDTVYPSFRATGNNNTTVPSPNIQIRTQQGTLVSNTTYHSGTTPPLSLVTLFSNTTTNLSYNPFTITVYAPGYAPLTTTASLLASEQFVISLIPLDIAPPNITFGLNPPSPILHAPVTIIPFAEENSTLTSLTFSLTYPNATVVSSSIANNTPFNLTLSDPGTYIFTITGSDSFGNSGNTTRTVHVGEDILLSLRSVGPNTTTRTATMSLFFPATSILVNTTSLTTPTPLFVPPGVYDLFITTPTFTAKLWDANLSTNLSDVVGIDNPTILGFKEALALTSPVPFTFATFIVPYTESLYANETLEVYRCAQWDFDHRLCQSTWENISFSQDTTMNTVTFSATNISVFAFKQPPFCGDAVCTVNENITSCPIDCQCTGGETKVCGTSSVGACKRGLQSCSGGTWGECVGVVQPQSEVCNGIDDNCDGLTDNIGGEQGIVATQCQCFAGGFPTRETCNGIDDNCNGLIDENLTRVCGNSTGICSPGIQSCINGSYGTCDGGIQPQLEICDNGIDDNCNGQIDECGSLQTCSQGAISSLCSCGGFAVETGYCCSSTYSSQACTPVDLTLPLVVVILILVIAIYVYKKKQQPTWNQVEWRYSYKN